MAGTAQHGHRKGGAHKFAEERPLWEDRSGA